MNKYWIHKNTGTKAIIYRIDIPNSPYSYLILYTDNTKSWCTKQGLDNYWIPITKAEHDSSLTLEEIKRNRQEDKLEENLKKVPYFVEQYNATKKAIEQMVNKDTFESICQDMIATHKAKDSDYGNSFHNLFKELGINYAYGHLREKLERIKTLKDNEAKVKGESMIDSLKDLANYAIMTIMELQNE